MLDWHPCHLDMFSSLVSYFRAHSYMPRDRILQIKFAEACLHLQRKYSSNFKRKSNVGQLESSWKEQFDQAARADGWRRQ